MDIRADIMGRLPALPLDHLSDMAEGGAAAVGDTVVVGIMGIMGGTAIANAKSMHLELLIKRVLLGIDDMSVEIVSAAHCAGYVRAAEKKLPIGIQAFIFSRPWKILHAAT